MRWTSKELPDYHDLTHRQEDGYLVDRDTETEDDEKDDTCDTCDC